MAAVMEVLPRQLDMHDGETPAGQNRSLLGSRHHYDRGVGPISIACVHGGERPADRPQFAIAPSRGAYLSQRAITTQEWVLCKWEVSTSVLTRCSTPEQVPGFTSGSLLPHTATSAMLMFWSTITPCRPS